MKSRFIAFLTLLLFPLGSLYAQSTNEGQVSAESANIELSRMLMLKDESMPKDITLKISANTRLLQFQIDANITAGQLAIEIIDTEDRVKWELSIASQASDYAGERTRATIQKSIKEPETGIWTVRIVPEKATGEMIIINTMIQE